MAKTELVKDKLNLPAGIDLESMSGAGMEAVSVKDIAIPFLKILQDLSPEIKKSKPEYIEGAEPGLICNTVTGELYKQLRVIPCFFNSVVNEWKPNRGGFVATHEVSSPVVTGAQRINNGKGGFSLQTKAGNELVDTANWYVLIEGKDGQWTWGVIAFTMTALKKSRKMMTQLQSIRMDGKNGPFMPPIYGHILDVTTALEQKDQNEWFNWKLDLAEQKTWENQDLFALAVQYHDQVKKGSVNAVPPSEEPETNEVY